MFTSLHWFFFFVYFNSLGFVFSEPFSNVFCEVCLLNWPVTIENFALGLISQWFYLFCLRKSIERRSVMSR